ncbi:TolC family protein [Pedobacter sp. MC2016-24]|uniref:TolC family protein n=1 Tax=Pedobacter sp. MC2016-24 TaxID=2780090 RepID=UPI0018824DF5|nr:TolC family protein [Pedobacter sp. MC2016-24]MBE9601969.1 TolC family protein [Pedobacter sp. MC2016-24]
MEPFKKYLYLGLLVLGFTTQAIAQDQEKKNLDFYLTQATSTSPLIKDFHNQLMMNKIDSLRLKARYGPQVTASSSGLYAPRIKGYGFDEVMTNGQSLDALLNVSYALTGNNIRTNQAQELSLQRDSLSYAIRISKLDLQKAITEQYIQAYESQQQVEFSLEIVSLFEKEDALLKQLTRSNVYKQTEYLTFLVTLKQQQIQYRQAQLQFKTDLASLNYLSGINDSTTATLAELTLEQDVIRQQGDSFFVTRFQIDSMKAVNEKKAVKLSYKPKLNLYANSGYNSSLLLQPYKNFGASAGFSLSIPIYDGHQKKMQQDRIDLQARTSSAYRNFFLIQRRQQIDMLYQQIQATNQVFSQINEQIKLSRGLIDVDSKLLRTGDVKISDFVIAINNYMAAQNALRQTNIKRLKLISQLNYWNQ